MGLRSVLLLLLASVITAQIVAPSNSSSDLSDPSTSPRFVIEAAGPVRFPKFTVAPLGQYAAIPRSTFISIAFSGVIVNTDATNANQVNSNDFNFVSCDPEHYEGGNLDANALLRIITTQQSNPNKEKSSLIFYSTRSNHCNVTDFNGLPAINGIFTTEDPIVASQIAERNFTRTVNAVATLTADRSAWYLNAGSGGPTTAIAMMILYSITGIITALFVIIIITGAVRAHRHPERYGPRTAPGRPRQSRARGIARAMLETLPIVKFGDHHDLPKDKDASPTDVEMASNNPPSATKNGNPDDKSATVTTTVIGTKAASTTGSSKDENEAGKNADGSDDAGVLGCSICTEDFQKGEEVRVLPCNHKFHPECVDPWLLNVSGTCPLCRISLTSESEQAEAGANTTGGDMPPPLAANASPADRRSQAIHNLMAMAYGSREERIGALRRYRTDRRNRSVAQNNENDEERVSRARRFREAFRIRTRRHEPTDVEGPRRDLGVEAISGPQMRI